MNMNKKFTKSNMMLAFIALIAVVLVVALAGFFLLTPPEETIMGQAEATTVRISGKVPGRIAEYRFGEGDQVKKGDTLWGIGQRYGAALADILAANPGIKNPNLIHPGDRVRIPL